MDVKKIGIWGGGLVGSFLVLLVLAYFLFPYLNPKKAAQVAKKNHKMEHANEFDPSEYNLQAVDSLKHRVTYLQSRIDSLQKGEQIKQKRIDSLKQVLSTMSKKKITAAQTQPQVSSKQSSKTSATSDNKETSTSLLNLDEGTLAPIVNLLEEKQLIRLFKEGSSRQREKLLTSLKPEKAAQILKKVMK